MPGVPPPLRRVLCQTRVRKIPPTGFGWIDRRLVTQGMLAHLRTEETLLYCFLCTVADKDGLSFYGDKRICQAIPHLNPNSIDRARRSLEHRGLIIFRHPLYQVLALPQVIGHSHLMHTLPQDHGPTDTEPKSIGEILSKPHAPWKQRHQKP